MKKTLAALILAAATALTGCSDSDENFVFTQPGQVQIIPAPICADDVYAGAQNTELLVTAANGVLANDTQNGATLTFPATTVNGGTVMGLADGSFSYTPANNFNGQDSFQYTLGNSGGVVTCTVTINVAAVNGFFVDAATGNDGTGSFNGGLPFATIQAAAAAAPAGSDIIVRAGNYTGAINLENGDRLLGEGSVLAQGTAVRPVLTGPVVMADGNTLDFLRIENAPSDAVDGDGQNNGTVTNCEVSNTQGGATNGAGVTLEEASGNWLISENNISGSQSLGVVVRTTGNTAINVRVNDNTITGNSLDAIGLSAEGNGQISAQVLRNTMSGNLAGATFEALAGGSSSICIDLEENTNDDVYRFSESPAGAQLQIEELSTLTDVSGANNTGTVSISGASSPLNEVVDGFCGF